MRPPFAQQRLSLEADGRVRLDLKKPWPTADGATSLLFEPGEFLRRLAALIPPPFAQLIRYHGLFAPRARDRELLPAAPVTDIRLEAWTRAGLLESQDRSTGRAAQTRDDDQAQDSAAPSPPPTPGAQASGGATTSGGLDVEPSRPGPPISAPSMNPPTTASGATPTPSSPPEEETFVLTGQRKRLRWRDLLRRVFSVDALVCPRCCGPLVVIAFITEMSVVQKILTHLGLPCEPPALSPARGPAQLELWDQPQCSAPHTAPAGTSRSRGPPRRAGPDFDFVEPDFDWGA